MQSCGLAAPVTRCPCVRACVAVLPPLSRASLRPSSVQSVLMNKGDKMYAKKAFISNPSENRRDLQKIVVRWVQGGGGESHLSPVYMRATNFTCACGSTSLAVLCPVPPRPPLFSTALSSPALPFALPFASIPPALLTPSNLLGWAIGGSCAAELSSLIGTPAGSVVLQNDGFPTRHDSWHTFWDQGCTHVGGPASTNDIGL